MSSFYKGVCGEELELVTQLEQYVLDAQEAALEARDSAAAALSNAESAEGYSSQAAAYAASSAADAAGTAADRAQTQLDIITTGENADRAELAAANAIASEITILQALADTLGAAAQALESANNAATSENNAANSASDAATSAQNASASASNALASENSASASANNAATSASNAANSAQEAQDIVDNFDPNNVKTFVPWTPVVINNEVDETQYPENPNGKGFEIVGLTDPVMWNTLGKEVKNSDFIVFDNAGVPKTLGEEIDDSLIKTIKGDWSPEVNGGVFSNIPDGAANNAYRIAGGGGAPLGLVLGDIVAFAPDGQTIYVLNKNYNSKLDDVVAGTNVSIDRTDPTRPKISAGASPVVAADWAPVLGTLTVPPVLTTEDSTAVNLTITNDNSILRQYHNTGLCSGMFKVQPHQLSFGKLKSAEQGVTLAVRPDTTKPGSIAKVYLGIFGKGTPLSYSGAGPSVVVEIDLVAQEAALKVITHDTYEEATTIGVIGTSAGTTWRLELTESYGNTTIRVWSSASPSYPILTHTTSADTSSLHNFAVGMWCNNTIGTAGRLDVVSYPSTGITNLPEGFENFGYRIANSVLAPQYNILEGDIVVFNSRAYMETVVPKAEYPLAANRTARIEESWEFAKPCEVAGIRIGNTQLDGNGEPVLATGTIIDTYLDTAITLGSRFLGAATGVLSELVHKGAGFSHLIVTAFATRGYHEGKEHRSRIFTRLASGDTFTKVEQVSEVHSNGVTSELVHAIESDGTVQLTLDGVPVGGAGGGRTQVLTTTGVGLNEPEDWGKVYYIDSATDVYVNAGGGFPPPAGQTIEATFVQIGAGAIIWDAGYSGFNGGYDEYKTTGVGSFLTATTDNGWEFYGYGQIEKV